MDEKKKPMEIEHETTHEQPSIMADLSTDPLGMWTGVPLNPNEVPTQDADDL